MRRLLKFVHTLSGAGFIGSAAAVAIVVALTSGAPDTPLARALAQVAAWVLGPSMVVTVISGLLAMAATPAFQNAGWVWMKAATGILILEGGLHALGPLQDAAKRGATASELGASEANTLWVLAAVSAANVALGVWRPRMPKRPA